jgi:hypothetical protein
MPSSPGISPSAGPYAKRIVFDRIERESKAMDAVTTLPDDLSLAIETAENERSYGMAMLWQKVACGKPLTVAQEEMRMWATNSRKTLQQFPLFGMPDVEIDRIGEALQRDQRMAVNSGHYLYAMVYESLIEFLDLHLKNPAPPRKE